jgi:shikimate dehydrogenase
LKTRLINESIKRGAKAIGGIEMLVRQGAIAFELWTGKEAPLAVMRKAALEAMGELKA